MSSETTESGVETSEELYCPHFENVGEETLHRLFSKVAAVRSADKALFDFTHRPIEVFSESIGGGGETEVVTEDQVYQQFSADRPNNFVVVIEGEVGTGKSELCAYLAHRLRDDGRPILHVDKDDDLMSLLTERIPTFYHEQFGEEMPGTEEFEQLSDDIENNPQTVANNATSGAILNLRSRGYEARLTPEAETKFSEHVQEGLEDMTARGEYAKEVKFVTAGDYNQKEFLDVFEEPLSDENAINILNEELWRVVRDRYGTASLSETLESVGDRFEDARPVIVFEDFSITAMEARKLRNYMERDNVEDNWDFIVAGTRDSTEVLHTRTAEDRFEFYQTNEQDSNSVLFLDEKTAVDFVRPYLGYLKSEHISDGSVAYERRADGTLTPQPLEDGTICAECALCPSESRDLFPFNDRFLRNIYTGLSASDQSPREFIMKVFDVFREYYDGYVDAPCEATALSPLTEPLFIPSPLDEEERLAPLLRWYGSRNDNEFSVEKRFAVAFGMLDEIETTEYPFELSTDDERITVSLGENPGDGEKPPKTKPRTKPDPKREVDPLQQRFEEHSLKLGPWKSHPNENIQTGVYLKAGLRAAIEHLTDDFKFFEGGKLQYRISSQQEPFVFTNTTGSVDAYQIRIDPDEFTTNGLRSLLKYGIYQEEDKRNADQAELLSAVGTQLTGYALDWRETVRATYLEDQSVLYKSGAGSRYDFADFALAAYALMTVFEDPWEPLTAERIGKRFGADEDFSVDDGVDMWCRDVLDKDQYEALATAFNNAEAVEHLVGQLLGVTDASINLREVRRRLDKHSPYTVLDSLRRNSIQNIPARIKFTDGRKFRGLANNVYDFRKAVAKLAERGPDEEVISLVESDLADITMSNIRPLVEKLETYDDVPAGVREPLQQFCDIDQDKVDEAVEAAEVAQKSADGSTGGRLLATLNSVKLRNSTVITRYDRIKLEGGDQTSGLGEEFISVGETYVK